MAAPPGGGGYEIVFASRYVAIRTDVPAGTVVEDLAPVPDTSLWLGKMGQDATRRCCAATRGLP